MNSQNRHRSIRESVATESGDQRLEDGPRECVTSDVHNSLDVKQLLEMIKDGQLSSEEGLRLYKTLQVKDDSEPETEQHDIVSNLSGGSDFKTDTVYCRSEWIPCSAGHPLAEPIPTGTFLIFDTDEALRDDIKDQVAGTDPVILVKPGESYEQLEEFVYQIHPARKQDYQSLFGSLKDRQLRADYVIQLSSFEGCIDSEETALRHLDGGLPAIFYTSQALLQQKPAGKATLLYLFPSTLTQLQPLRSAVGGFARSLHLENPHLFCRAIEVCPLPGAGGAVESSQWLEVVRREMSEHGSDETEVRYEQERRFTRRLIEIDKQETRVTEVPIRANGVYLVTGGLGALGLHFAEYLAGKPNVKVVLTGRTPLTAEGEVSIRKLEALGAEVVYWQADVSSKEAVRELIAKIRSRFNAIHGVIHSAGVIRDAFLLKKTESAVAEVLAPKVSGTVYLDEELKEEKLDFFVLFSSLVALTGNPGQCDYAYANSFLDHFAASREQLRRQQKRSGRTLSINWPLWRAGGMFVSEEAKRWAQETTGLVPLDREDGLRAFADGLRLPYSQLAVFSGDPPKMRLAYRLNAAPLTTAPVKSTIPTPPATEDESEHLQATAEMFLKTVLSREIKLPVSRVHSDHPLEKYGIDSMMIMNLTRDIEELFGALPKTLFFEYQNIAELADYFVKNHAEKLIEISGKGTAQRRKVLEQENARRVAGWPGQSRFLAAGNPKNGNRSSNGNGNGNGHQTTKAGFFNFIEREEDIAIIGIAGRYPGAETPEEFWDNLKSGKDCITEIPRERWDYRSFFDADKDKAGKSYSKWGGFIEDVDKFDPLFFNISPREAELMDPQERLFLETVWQTFEDAGYTRAALAKEKAGVYVGVMYAQYQLFGAEETLKGNVSAPGNFFASIANRISYFFNLHGPSIALDTLCSSSLTAIHLACESIQRGEIDIAVAGGVNVTIHPSKYFNLSQGKFASSDGRCRSFGEGGDGYVPGEGVGAILLKPLSKAIADGDYIYAAIRKTAINHGGKTNGVTVPNPKAQSELIGQALKNAGIEPRQISYLEAHGTGTALGDPIEITGLTKAFRNLSEERYASDTQYCAVGSVKSNIGHLESAAGIAGVTKVLLQMKHGQLAPSLHSESLNPNIDFQTSPFYVQRELADWKRPVLQARGEEIVCPRLAGVSSFGAGGANAHIILEEYVRPVDDTDAMTSTPELVLLSARNRDRLKEYATKLTKFLTSQSITEGNNSLANLAFTLQIGREPMQERLALVVLNQTELIEKLNQYCRGETDIAGLYSGSVIDNQIGALLIEGEAGASFFSALMNARDLAKLAQLWAAGAEIDWQPFHDGRKPRRIPLPTYPFARERYWIPVSGKPLVTNTDERLARLHPLLDVNTSDLEEQKFTTHLREHEFYLADHVIGGRKILPGVAVLEMARAAGEIAGADRVQKVTNTVWLSPIVFDPDDEKNEINISLYPGEGKVNYEVWSLRGANPRDVHAQGRLIFGNSNSDMEPLDLKAILARCQSLSGEECYERFRQRGINYGERFRSIRELFFNDAEAVARLQLPAGLDADFRSFSFHPALLDGALQAVLGLITQDADSEVLNVPFSLGEIEQINPLEQTVYAHMTRVLDMDQSSAVQKFNVRLVDEEGKLLVRINDFSTRAFKQLSALGFENNQAETDESILYRPVWKEKAITRPTLVHGSGSTTPEAVLIFDTGLEVRDALNEQLRLENTGARAILVQPGDSFSVLGEDSYAVNPVSKDDYQQLFTALAQRNLRTGRILHLWSYRERDDTAESLSRQLNSGFYSTLYLTQALMGQKPERQIRLLYVHAERGSTLQPACAAVSALAKTIRLENPKFSYRTLGLQTSRLVDHDQPATQLAQMLLEFQLPSGTDEEVRYEGEQRQVRVWDEYEPGPASDPPRVETITKEGGVYLITGGAGGLGLIFAEYLASKAQVRLILTGRSELNTEQAARLRAMESGGAQVIHICSDVSQREEVERLIAGIKSRFGAINGVIHAAGVTRDAFVLNKTAEDISAVLAPKVYGTMWLDEATVNDQLDFFVLFSSAAGVLGNVGQSDYAFANSFADHFAAQREELRAQNKRTGKTLSINWPLWQDGGLQTSEAVRIRMRQTMGLVPLKTADGLQTFEAGLRSHHAQLMVLSGDRRRIARAVKAHEADPGHELSSEHSESEVLTTPAPGEQLLQRVDSYLKRILSAEIKLPVDKISSREPLEQYGIDSVMVMNLTRQLEVHFGELSKTLLFEYRNISELGRYFVENHPTLTVEKFGGHQTTSAAQKNLTPERGSEIVSRKRPRFLNTAHRSARREAIEREDIAIIGMSGRYPMADDLVQFWENLRAGKDCISEIPGERWSLHQVNGGGSATGKSSSKWGGFINDVDKFDSLFFNISPKEAKIIDPQERLFLETVWHTIEDGGYTRERLEKSKTGIFVGVMYAHYQLFSVEAAHKGTGFTPSSLHASIANRVSYVFNFRGPSIALDTMCSSSLTAVHLACASLHQGDCEVAIAGGVNVSIHPNKYVALSEAKFTSSDGRCRSFGEGGDGYVPGEGVGALMLKPLSQAVADGDHIYGIIKGSAINHGGKTNGYTVPNPMAQGKVIAEALKKSKLDPRKITYLEAHGTGTSLGDPIEIAGLVKAFHDVGTSEGASDKQYCSIGSVKSNIGHLESAAGIAGITKVLLQMKHRELVPSLHSESLNPHINFEDTPFFVQRTLEPWTPSLGETEEQNAYPRQAGISSFGAGGSNVHIILEEYRATELPDELSQSEPQFITLSARTEERLKVYAGKLADFLSRDARARKSPQTIHQDISQKVQSDLLSIAGVVLNLDPREIDPTEEMGAYGVDPVRSVALVEQLNRKYGVEINPAVINKFPRFQVFSRHIAEEHREQVVRYYQGSPTVDCVNSEGKLNLADFAYTLQIGREAMEERLALVVSSVEDLGEKLARYSQGETDIEGLYQGNVRHSKSRSELLLEGKEGVEFIQTVIAQRKWHKLAQLWLLGVEIDWSLLHRNADGSTQRRQRLPLPTYPFARIRHWLPESTSAEPESNRGLHPLVDRVDSRRSFQQNQSIVFNKTLRNSDPLIKDHRVLNRTILPGVGYLAMAHAALSQVDNADSFKLARVVLLQPLAVTDEKEVQIVIKEENGLLHFEIQSGDETTRNAGAGANPITHARGECRQRPPGKVASQRLSLEEIKARCKEEIRKEDLYPQFRAIGIEYGAYYQRVEHIWGGDEEALGLLTLPQEHQQELQHYTLHPTMLDGALQVIAGLAINRQEREELVLPFAIDEVEILRPLTARAYAHVKLIERDRYDVVVVDEQGEICVRLNGLALRKVKAKDSLPDFFYLPGWKSAPLATNESNVDGTTRLARTRPQAELKRTTLLFHPPQLSGLERPLIEVLAGDNVVCVSLGTETTQLSENRWVIDTRDSDSLDRCLGQFEALDGLYFLGGVQIGETNVADLSALEQSQEFGVLSLFRLSKSLIRLGFHRRPLRLRVITNEAHQVLPGEVVKPYAASLFGLVKSLAKEHPQWSVSSIDINLHEETTVTRAPGDTPDSSELIHSIIAEPAHPKGDEIALRHGQRYVRSLTPVQLPPVNRTPFRQGGVYLILGGAGGIGLELSKHLAETVQARLVLVGRGELNEEQRDQIAAIESLGGSVLYVRADATDLASMRSAVEQAKTRFGQLHGVVHSALVLKDKTVEMMTEEEFRSALLPKVQGSVNLHLAVAGEALDFMLFFSSAQSFSGNAGQSNYAAGCTFKDGFADYLRQVVPYAVKTINWGYWGEVGVVASPEYNRRLAAQGVGSIDSKEGMEAVRRVLTHPIDQVMPVKVDNHLLAAMGVDPQHCVTLHPVKTPSVFSSAVQQITKLPDDAERLHRSRQAFDEVAALGQELLLSVFQQMGVFKEAGKTYERESLRSQLRIAPPYFRLFDALLDTLGKAGVIRVDGPTLTSTGRLEDSELKNRLSTLVERKQQVAETFPEVVAHVELLWTCSQQYQAILKGEVRATDVIFPGSSMRLVEGIYKGNVVSDRCNQQVARSVESYVRARLPRLAANEKLRILEVGAGTGGTTAAVLSAISTYATQVQYVYTDLSPGFTQHGRKQFGAIYPFVEFKVLNIENDVQVQGYVPGDFDLLIGANVLHATRDLRSTLQNTKALLKTNGWLVLNEVTDVQDFTTLTFGLLDGWWVFDDADIRLPGAPLLSPALWERLLKEEGFRAVHTSRAAGKDDDNLGQHVIVAESNGQVMQRKLASPSANKTKLTKPRQLAATKPAGATVTTPLVGDISSSNPNAVQAVPDRHPQVAQVSGSVSRTQSSVDDESDPEVLLDRIEQTIVGCVADALTMSAEEIDRERQFSEYGVDSIIGVDLIDVINTSLGLTLRTTALFDYGNVNDLARFICDEHGSQLMEANVASQPSSVTRREAAIEVPGSNSLGDLALLEKLAGGELGTEQVYQMLEASYEQL